VFSCTGCLHHRSASGRHEHHLRQGADGPWQRWIDSVSDTCPIKEQQTVGS
jgi:hypothetical protein